MFPLQQTSIKHNLEICYKLLPGICHGYKANTTRNRTCDSPAPENGGQNCTGLDYDIKECPTTICPGNIQNIRAYISMAFLCIQ